MTSRTVRYWLKTTETAREPLAASKAELWVVCRARGLVWCGTCQAAVEPEGFLDNTGINNRCPFCGEEIAK
jgi:hypothetical protein